VRGAPASVLPPAGRSPHQAAASVSPGLSEPAPAGGTTTTGSAAGGAAVGGAATASAHFSFHSSIVMCCCRHSRLQNAVSPLRAEQENSVRHQTHTHKLLQFFFFFSDP